LRHRGHDCSLKKSQPNTTQTTERNFYPSS
jgi:hypothetical protein